MKKLFFALICIAIGFSASANNLMPMKKMTTETKIEVATSLNTNRVETESSARAASSLFRRQMHFTFTDSCGQAWTVYVSGPSSATNHSLWETAFIHFKGTVMSNYWGCYDQ